MNFPQSRQIFVNLFFNHDLIALKDRGALDMFMGSAADHSSGFIGDLSCFHSCQKRACLCFTDSVFALVTEFLFS